MDYKVEKIPQYKPDDMIVLVKFKPVYGFKDDTDHPRLATPYRVIQSSIHSWVDEQGEVVELPAVLLGPIEDCSYHCFAYWWIPIEIIEHARSMDELAKFIKDKVKAVKGA